MNRTWRVDLPLVRPLNLNDRQHWRVKATLVQQVRAMTKLAVQRANIPPLKKISIELHYTPRDKRRRDPLNLVATLKPVEDGIVDAGIIPDDTADYSIPTMPVIDPPDSSLLYRFHIIITDRSST